jgi:hypothetical protein
MLLLSIGHGRELGGHIVGPRSHSSALGSKTRHEADEGYEAYFQV